MGSPAVGVDHRAALWREMLLADFNHRYWNLLSQRDFTIDKFIRVILALSSGGVTAWSVWAHYPFVLTCFSMATCVVAVFHTSIYTTERLKRVAALVGAWKQISIEYDLLWECDSDLSSEGTWKRFEDARKREGSIDETGLPIIGRLSEKAFQQMMQNRGLKTNGKQ